MSHQNQFVTIEKCAELYGLTVEAIRQYKKKGQGKEKLHWVKAPNGRIFIKLKAVDAWIEGKGA